jgi:hypothetical protein
MKNARFVFRAFVALLLVGLAQPTRVSSTAGALSASPTGRQISSSRRPDAVTRQRMSDNYGRLPLSFERNEGQADRRAEFISRGRGYAMFLARGGEAVLVLTSSSGSSADPSIKKDGDSRAALRLKLTGADKQSRAHGRDELPGKANYLRGNDPKQWRTGIPTYAKVAYEDVYPGIDLVYYGNQRQLEYDLIVHPGADPRLIALEIEGADRLDVDTAGDLVLQTAIGVVRQRKPVIYQMVDGQRREIAGGYVRKGARHVGFQIAAYEAGQPLVIDPVLNYSTYVGGSSGDEGFGIAVDQQADAYVTGSTSSTDFPTMTGSYDTSHNGGNDVFVTKLNQAGSALLYSTYIGGSSADIGESIAVDVLFNAYVTGETRSTDFPTTPLAFDTSHNGGEDAFVAVLNATGSGLVYSTFLGGSADEQGRGIAVDLGEAAYVAGVTTSSNFPTTTGAFDNSYNFGGDGFVTKLNVGGMTLAYSTFLGGGSDDAARAIALNNDGTAHVTGYTRSSNFPTTPGAFDTTRNGSPRDAFVTKLNAFGTAPLLYSTLLGGTSADEGAGIVVDDLGFAYVTGLTNSPDFPVTLGAPQPSFGGGPTNFDAFVTKLNVAGSAPLVYSTYLGGSSEDEGRGIALDVQGRSHVTGFTSSSDFPTTIGAYDTSYNGGLADAFLTTLDLTGTAFVHSTFLGGSQNDRGRGVAADQFGSSYVTGFTASENFPTTAGAFDTTHNGGRDVFVTKIADFGPPATLTLDPPAATNPVDSRHCVTATVTDAFGNPVPGVTVYFTVTGSVSASGSATTNAAGQAIFCYDGPPLPGADVITAFADTDDDGTQDPGEPTGAAAKIWELPVTTPLCEITITNGGWIIAANGDRASFGGNAKSSETGETQGQEEYHDHGPAQPMNVHSINVLAIVCDGPGDEASIYGRATIDGSGSFFYRIKVRDLEEPGAGADTYWMLLQTGYNSLEQVLRGGNVQIRRQ